MTPKDILLKSLTVEQRKTLQRDNPYRCERNALIQELYAKGVDMYVLSDVTGLSKSTVHRISTQGYVYGRREGAQFREVKGKVDLNGIKKAMKALYNEVLKAVYYR